MFIGKIKAKELIKLISLMILCIINMPALASVNVYFEGKLIDNPPCDIYGSNGKDQVISIAFNDLGITDIFKVGSNMNKNYQKSFTLTVNCGSSLGSAVTLFLGYSGVKAPFDNNALQTTIENLAIYLESDGTAVKPEGGISVVIPSNGVKQLSFIATPVRNNIMPNEGEFTATATIQMLYP
ncbi:fimbrial protein [Providencia manganoxydans]|uniref:fimbrial protein n=1 Tax=Providencia manganoxydans TaxID=2923283 RepID=UPI0034DD4A39